MGVGLGVVRLRVVSVVVNVLVRERDYATLAIGYSGVAVVLDEDLLPARDVGTVDALALTTAPLTCGWLPVTNDIREGTHSGQLTVWR